MNNMFNSYFNKLFRLFLVFFFLFFFLSLDLCANAVSNNHSQEVVSSGEQNVTNILSSQKDLLVNSSKPGKLISRKINSLITFINSLSPDSSDCENSYDLVLVKLSDISSLIDARRCSVPKNPKKTLKCIPPDIADEVISNIDNAILAQGEINSIDENENDVIDICEDGSLPISTPEPSSTPTPSPSPDVPLITTTCNSSHSIQTLPALSTLNLDFTVSDPDFGDIDIYKIEESEGNTFILHNKTLIPLEFKITLGQNENLKSTIPDVIRVPSNAKVAGFKLCQDDNSKQWSYDGYSYKYKLGLSTNTHTWDGMYILPYRPGQAFQVIQGEHGTFSHFDDLIESVDIKMPEGTDITAMRDGTVIYIKQDSNENGTDPSFKGKSNYIWVLHDDGTIATYVHLRQNGSAVKVGDKIKAGDLVCYSGNTGFSTTPHLHYQVFLRKGFSETEYIPVRFKGIEGALEEGSSYTALPLN